MGSSAAMQSIDRVLRKHGEELGNNLWTQYKSKLIRRFMLANDIYRISVTAELQDGTFLQLKPYDIDELAERFPDCKVGY